MRADRLLSLLLLLQERGKRVTAKDVARRLQISERTVYRDLDALSAAGVPVYAQSGPGGGIALLGDWQAKLTGLTDTEAQALAVVGVPGALSDVGLSKSLRAGLIKLAAGLPPVQQQAAEHARERLLIDNTSWFEERESVPYLDALREGVWGNQRVRLRYRDFDGRVTERTVAPYGLVIKSDRWYLVGATTRGPTVFRGSRVERARLLPESFSRPEGFDLGAFWRDWSRRFAERRERYLVTLRLSREGEKALRLVRPREDGERMAKVNRDKDGFKVVTLDFERRTIALAQLAPAGKGVLVLEPEELREDLRQMGVDLGAAYR